eukprot:11948551-Alexandrium_andersonii.AAC.1
MSAPARMELRPRHDAHTPDGHRHPVLGHTRFGALRSGPVCTAGSARRVKGRFRGVLQGGPIKQWQQAL